MLKHLPIELIIRKFFSVDWSDWWTSLQKGNSLGYLKVQNSRAQYCKLAYWIARMTSLHLFDQWCSSSSIRAAATSFFSTDYDTMRCTKVFPSQNHQTFNYDPHSLLSDATLTATSDGMAASLGIKTPLSTHNKSSKKNWERKKISKGAECRNSAPNKSSGTALNILVRCRLLKNDDF